MKCPNYLERRDGRFYLKRRVPKALVAAYGKTVIRRALGTADIHEARIRLRQALVEIDAEFASLAVGNEGPDVASAPSPGRVGRQGQPVSSLSLSDAAARFIADRRESWGRKTLLEYRSILPIIIEIIGDKPLTRVTRQDCRHVKDVVPQIPTNVTKRPQTRNLKIVDAIKWAEGNAAPTLSPETINKYISSLTAFMSWAETEGHITHSPARGLRLPKRAIQDRTIRRRPFTNEELRRIFSSPPFDEQSEPHSDLYWIPLIGLYTGMRLNEICQLRPKDILQINDVWAFNVSDEAVWQKLKNASSRRAVPIHSDLLERGIAAFARSRQSHERLFHELTLPKSGFLSDCFSKKFNRRLRATGFDTKETVFHSFRHTFRDALRAAEVPTAVAKALGGWSDSSISEGYGSGYPIAILRANINKIRFFK